MSNAVREEEAFFLPFGANRALRYANRVLATAPIAYWKLNEGSGSTITDSSGNGYNGSYSGVALAQATPPMGGKAPSWDGINDYGAIYSAGLAGAFNLDEYTILFWENMTSSTFAYYLSMFRDANNYMRAYIPTPAANKFRRVGTGTFRDNDSTPGGGWNSWIISCSIAGGGLLAAGEQKLYKNGSLINTAAGNIAATGSGLDSAATGLGGLAAGGFNTGNMAHVAIWSRPIDSAILALGTV